MKDKYIIAYYAALIFAILSWTNQTTAPSMPLRLGFLFAVIMPPVCLKEYSKLLIPVISCFWCIATNGYAYSYMPTMSYIYLFVLIVCSRLMNKIRFHHLIVTRPILFLLVEILIINIITQFGIGELGIVFSLFMLSDLFISNVDSKLILYFELLFLILTIVLSYYSFTTHDLFIESYGHDGLERSGWTDPNYLGVIIGFGGLISLSNLFVDQYDNKYIKIISILVFALCVPVLLRIASRGALLCITMGTLVLFFFSKARIYYKLLVVGGASALLLYLYNNSYFELLEYRIAQDDGTGGNRTDIWSRKLSLFFENGNVVNLLLGFGSKGGYFIQGYGESFHNDFLSFLVCFGFVGFFLFVYFMLSPIIHVNRKSKWSYRVFAGVTYLTLASMTLEPFGLGRYIHYVFLLYLILVSKYSWTESK